MTPRPALVDPPGGPITGNRGGPMPLAKPAATWSHLAGKRHDAEGTYMVTLVNGQVEVPAGGHQKSPPLGAVSGFRWPGLSSFGAGFFHAERLALGGDDDGVME
jgi:hypothetical protein